MAPNVSVLFLFTLILMFVQTHAEFLSHSVAQKTSPFEFMEGLQGSRKGDKAKGLNELKKYLHHFGYLSDSYKVQINGDNEDNFDDVLESAIKTYQLNYNLNVTGTLDAKTISTMMLPRCGVPDIVNGETWMRAGKVRTMQDHHGHNKKVNMVSNYSLFPGRNKWPGTRPRLTYGFDNYWWNVPFVIVMNRAFRRWARATPRFSFRLVQNAATANIKIGVFVGGHGDGNPFDGPGGVLAHAFAPTDGRLHFDGQENFAVGRNPGPFEIHLETVAVHEIGHNLGLGHSSDPAAIMFPSVSPGQTKHINSDDINGINALYN